MLGLGLFEVVAILVVLALAAALVAAAYRVARRKGRDAWGWAIATLVFPLCLLALLLLPRRQPGA